MTEHGRHLGLVVYRWELDEQSRLVVECLAPRVAQLRHAGLRFFWFDRFDARGPHVLALFTLPASEIEPATALLGAGLGEYLASHPGRRELSGEELAARHAACSGKVQCEADARPGFGDRDSFLFLAQPADGYPFKIGQGLRQPARLWELLDELAGWAVEQLAGDAAANPIRSAVQWLMSLRRILDPRCAAPDAYWRYHLATLGLRAPVGPAEIVGVLTRVLGEKNDSTLTRIWERGRAAPLACPSLPRLVELVLGEAASGGVAPWGVLRHVVHFTLKQLGLPVKSQIPVLLFAWRSGLAERLSSGVSV